MRSGLIVNVVLRIPSESVIKMSKKLIFTAIMSGLLTVSLTACQMPWEDSKKTGETKKEKGKKAPIPIVITTTPVETKMIKIEANSHSGIVDKPGLINVASPLTGKIIKVSAKKDDVLTHNQSIAEFETESYVIQEQDSQAELDRLNGMKRASDITLPANFETLYRQASTQNQEAKRHIKLASLKAPAAGKVTQLTIQEGTQVSRGQILFEITPDVKQRTASFIFPAKTERLAVGQKISMSIKTAPDNLIERKVQELRKVKSGDWQIKVLLDEAIPWAPGTNVDAVVEILNRPTALMVPEKALVTTPEGQVIFVYKKDSNTVQQRLVKTGEKREDLVEITEGIKEGEVVAIENNTQLKDNHPVAIKGSPEAAQAEAAAAAALKKEKARLAKEKAAKEAEARDNPSSLTEPAANPSSQAPSSAPAPTQPAEIDPLLEKPKPVQ